ncbi:hypothetical protein BSKO_14161 [Bryopsis sp. KO-2023]|nr:hypothetical protein BSKO_14161 [Bryopsis sp. KO-2023]
MVKALDEFRKHYCPEQDEEAGKDCSNADAKALQYATLYFFAGIVCTYILDLFVHRIMDHAHCFGGLMSGIAIALHNFPEGLATFVATLADPTAGVAIAVAIALHNIPEGVVVAMPIYYSTGSRLKGFMWAFLSGVSEPIGGIFGWAVLTNMGEIAYAVLFAIVAGTMVYISVSELIPTALRFDTADKYVTKSCFVGMAVMAASLLMFTV